MEDLTQTISNLVGILLGVVGAIGVGFFIYGAYLYLTASGAPAPDGARQERNDDGPGGRRPGPGRLRHRRAGGQRRGGFARGPQPARPGHPHARFHRRRIGRRERGERHERSRGAHARPGRGPGAAGVHLPAGGGDGGGVRNRLRRVPLRPRRPLRGEDGDCRHLRTGRTRHGRGEDRREAAAAGGRRPAQVPAGGAALRRAGLPAGENRGPGAAPVLPTGAAPARSG